MVAVCMIMAGYDKNSSRDFPSFTLMLGVKSCLA